MPASCEEVQVPANSTRVMLEGLRPAVGDLTEVSLVHVYSQVEEYPGDTSAGEGLDLVLPAQTSPSTLAIEIAEYRLPGLGDQWTDVVELSARTPASGRVDVWIPAAPSIALEPDVSIRVRYALAGPPPGDAREALVQIWPEPAFPASILRQTAWGREREIWRLMDLAAWDLDERVDLSPHDRLEAYCTGLFGLVPELRASVLVSWTAVMTMRGRVSRWFPTGSDDELEERIRSIARRAERP